MHLRHRTSWRRRGAFLEAWCAQHGVALRAAALQFAAAHPAVRSLIVGMIAPKEIDETLAALRAKIPAAFWVIQRQGLIDANAPNPPGIGTIHS